METEMIIKIAGIFFSKWGRFPPGLWIEFTEGKPEYYPLLNFPRDAAERQDIFFAAGKEMSRRHPGRQIRQICFLVGTWFYERLKEERREGLIALFLDVVGEKHVLSKKLFEITKEAKKVKLSLVQRSFDCELDGLLPSCMEGFCQAGMQAYSRHL